LTLHGDDDDGLDDQPGLEITTPGPLQQPVVGPSTAPAGSLKLTQSASSSSMAAGASAVDDQSFICARCTVENAATNSGLNRN
jgi:hypothetical protein